MILNWNYGMEMGLELVSKTFTAIESNQSLEMPLTVTPLAIFLRTSAGGNAELCAYYRTDQAGDYTMRASAGGAAAYTRLSFEMSSFLMLHCTGGTMAQPATLECIVLGVKR